MILDSSWEMCLANKTLIRTANRKNFICICYLLIIQLFHHLLLTNQSLEVGKVVDCLCVNIKEINLLLLLMTHYQQKEENYAKWQSSIWNSVEKEITLFQKKVTDCMLLLGDLNKKRKEDFKVEPTLEDDVILGEDFYIEMIRPFCVDKQYLPKKPPTPEEVEDILFQQQLERMKLLENVTIEEKKDKKAGKKGAKGQGAKNDEKMKLKIVKDNFQKDIELVMKSHSLERMQVQFGLKLKKLELKLITFFYVAFYIRKNKVNQKIDQSEIFELINILIKIVRIFSHYQGPSFGDSSKKIEVSPTLMLDLKFCIKGLKQYYKYTNKTVIIRYPKLVYYTIYDRFFPTLDIKPYDSQIEFIQAVKGAFNERGSLARPTLVFYRTMIGSGKTSASLALSQLIHQCKLLDNRNNSLQVLYSCLIGSVRVQVGRYCYNKQQKFALAAMEKSIKDEEYYYPRIINSWSCRNEKIVDLIISDLYCAYEMLDYHNYTKEEEDIMKHEVTNRKNLVNRGKVDRENIVLFVDQPTAFCKSTDSKATRKLFDILANYPPRLIIFASATMPSASELPKTIELVRRKNPDLNVIEVNSKEFQIGCQYCSFKGQVIFPHTGVKNRAQLVQIIDILRKNSFLLKLYTGPSLFFLLKKCIDIGLKGMPEIDELPEVRQDDITRATFKILEMLSKQKDDVIEQVCALSRDETIMDFKDDLKKDSDDQMFDFLEDNKEAEQDREEEEEKEDFVNFKRMLKGDAYKFLGGCLIGTSDPIAFAHQMFEKWVRKIKPIKRLKEKYDKQVEELDREIRLLEDDTEMREQKKTQKISKLQSEKEPKLDFPEHKKINTSEHYQKYCKNKEASHISMLIKPIPIENSNVLDLIEEVDDFILKLLFCGIGVYSEKGLSAKYLDKVEELASLNFLAFIITDESLCYGTNFPISNVILRDELVERLNMNQMFQLIGRAGRVGQSWTARAFLEPKGLQKLHEYIHKPQKQLNGESEIFEALAEEHLNYPLLRLRNMHSEVRYLDGVENSEFIEIEIKKKDQESHLLKKIALVPYVATKNGPLYLCSNKYKGFKHFSFPSTSLTYSDIPTIKNKNGQDIIDVALFYKDFKEYLYRIADSAIKRLFQSELQGKVTAYTIINHLKPKVYEPFYNSTTNTLAILVKCDAPQNLRINSYQFQAVIGNGFGELLDETLMDKIRSLVADSVKIVDIFMENALNTPYPEVKKVFANHLDIASREKAAFYAEMIKAAFEEGSQIYTAAVERFHDKDLLDSADQVKTILAIQLSQDVRNCMDKLFHIFPLVRELWRTIEAKVEESLK